MWSSSLTHEGVIPPSGTRSAHSTEILMGTIKSLFLILLRTKLTMSNKLRSLRHVIILSQIYTSSYPIIITSIVLIISSIYCIDFDLSSSHNKRDYFWAKRIPSFLEMHSMLNFSEISQSFIMLAYQNEGNNCSLTFHFTLHWCFILQLIHFLWLRKDWNMHTCCIAPRSIVILTGDKICKSPKRRTIPQCCRNNHAPAASYFFVFKYITSWRQHFYV